MTDLDQYIAALRQERATSAARRRAADILRQYVQILLKDRIEIPAWVLPLSVAASSDRKGCMTCGGSGWVSPSGQTEWFRVVHPQDCSDCDSDLPGFAREAGKASHPSVNAGGVA